MDLSDFLNAELLRPAAPGFCCLMVDRWVAVRRGVSPMALAGRPHESEADVAAWIGGNLAAPVCRAMRAAGLAKTAAPVEGDAGLIALPGLLTMALLSGGRWVRALGPGLAEHRPERVRLLWAWRVGETAPARGRESGQ